MLEENKELGQQTKEIAILNDINSFLSCPSAFLNLQHGGIVVPHDWPEAKNLNQVLPVKKFEMEELSQTCRLKTTIWDSVLPESSTT